MIYYNLNTINDWFFSTDNIIKVYRNNVVCYYKIDSSSPSGQTPCYAVVDDISQYSDTEFEDVFNKADGKWYKLNNLDEYEQYGVYGSGRTITTYEGKLTIDEEITPSRLPAGYTEVEYIQNTGTSYINTDYYPNQDTRIVADMQVVTYNTYGRLLGAGNHNTANTISCDYADSSNTFEISWGGYTGWSQYTVSSSFSKYDKHTYDWNKNNFYIDGALFDTKAFKSFTCSYKLGIFNVLESNNQPTSNTGRYFYGKLYSFKIYDNDTLVRDFVPAKRDNDSKYGLYDIVNDVFYLSPNNNSFIGGSEIVLTATCEYQYSGGSWVNVGEISGSTRLPAGYTEVEYVENNTKGAYINLGLPLYDAIGNSFNITGKLSSEYYAATGYNDLETLINSESISSPYYGFTYRYAHSSHILEFTSNPSNSVTISTTANTDGTTSLRINCNSTTVTDQVPLGLFASYSGNYNTPYRWAYMKLYYLQVTKNNTLVRDLVPCKRDSDSMVGMYDIANDVFYYPPNYSLYQLVAGTQITGGTEYPLYYDEIQDPPNNLSFSSMTEAEEYECPWVGMAAIIDGVRYVFSGDSQTGYEWVEYIDYANQYLTFVAVDSGTFKLNGNSVYYSLDNGSTWNSLASNTNSPTVSAGSNIMFKATLAPSSNGIGKFSSTANFTVEGNPMSLLYGDNFIGQTDLTGKNYAFNSLFSGCITITSAENVSLPATILSTSCYQYMFLDCSNLSIAPSALSATSLADNCYNGMFGNCTSLTTAPKMLATTLVGRCCQYMYINCSSLNSVTCLATNPSTSYTTNWLSGVAASGTFYKSPNATWSTGVNGIPSNWTVENYNV